MNILDSDSNLCRTYLFFKQINRNMQIHTILDPIIINIYSIKHYNNEKYFQTGNVNKLVNFFGFVIKINFFLE